MCIVFILLFTDFTGSLVYCAHIMFTMLIAMYAMQWKRAGPISQGSADQTHALLNRLMFKDVRPKSTEPKKGELLP